MKNARWSSFGVFYCAYIVVVVVVVRVPRVRAPKPFYAMTTPRTADTLVPEQYSNVTEPHTPAFSGGPGSVTSPAWHDRAPSARLATGRNRFRHGRRGGGSPRRAVVGPGRTHGRSTTRTTREGCGGGVTGGGGVGGGAAGGAHSDV